MRTNRICQILFFILLSISFPGCGESPLKLSVRYDTLGELKSKVPVYFEKKEIGQVEKIVSTDHGDYLVYISIYPDFKNKATDKSKFFILDDPYDTDQKAIIIEQEPRGGVVLSNGSIVLGEKKQGLLDEFVRELKMSTAEATARVRESMQNMRNRISENTNNLNEQLERSLNDIDRYLQDFTDSMKSSLNSDDLEKLKKSIDDFIEEFKNSSREVQDFLKDEIVPKLREGLEALRDKLQDEGRDNDAVEINDQINEILKI